MRSYQRVLKRVKVLTLKKNIHCFLEAGSREARAETSPMAKLEREKAVRCSWLLKSQLK